MKTTELFMTSKSEFEQSSLRDNFLIEFNVQFSYANLKDINKGIIYIKDFQKEISIKNSLEMLDLAIKKNNCIRIWSSHVDPDFYLFLLFICSYINGKVKTLEVFFSDEYKSDCINTGVMLSSELNKLASMSHTISEEEIEKYAFMWNYLNKDGSKIHIFENGDLIEVEYEYLYKQVIDYIRKKRIALIAEINYFFIKKYKIDIQYLIKNLINEKRIIIIKKEEIFSRNIVSTEKNVE